MKNETSISLNNERYKKPSHYETAAEAIVVRPESAGSDPRRLVPRRPSGESEARRRVGHGVPRRDGLIAVVQLSFGGFIFGGDFWS